jgi:hypothetical protein
MMSFTKNCGRLHYTGDVEISAIYGDSLREHLGRLADRAPDAVRKELTVAR